MMQGLQDAECQILYNCSSKFTRHQSQEKCHMTESVELFPQNPPGTKHRKMPHVRICRTFGTHRAGAKEGNMPHGRICKTVHTNPPGTKHRKLPHVRICRALGTNRVSRDPGDHLVPPADLRKGKIH